MMKGDFVKIVLVGQLSRCSWRPNKEARRSVASTGLVHPPAPTFARRARTTAKKGWGAATPTRQPPDLHPIPCHLRHARGTPFLSPLAANDTVHITHLASVTTVHEMILSFPYWTTMARFQRLPTSMLLNSKHVRQISPLGGVRTGPRDLQRVPSASNQRRWWRRVAIVGRVTYSTHCTTLLSTFPQTLFPRPATQKKQHS